MTASRLPEPVQLGRCAQVAVALLGGITLIPLPARTRAQQSVRGMVVNADTQEPVDHASLLLLAPDGTATGATLSDSVGRFAIAVPNPGEHALRVQRAGFVRTRPNRLYVPANSVVSVQINLTPDPIVLEGVTVTGQTQRLSPEIEEFLARRRTRMGYGFTRADMERLNAQYVVDLLREIPGFVTLGGSPATRTYALNHNRCPPKVFVDGVLSRLEPNELLENLSLFLAYGVEVFRDRSSAPGEYALSDPRGCGIILIWTRAVEP